MLSLRRLLADRAPLLVLDAASARIQVGWCEEAGSRWAASDEEAGVGIFRAVEALGIDLGAVRSFAFAEEPGSVLGIRIAAMTLRTWCAVEPRPVFAYHALVVLAQAQERPDLGFIADARKETWHYCRRDERPRRLPSAELAGPLAMPAGFRHWSALPAGVERVPYDLADLFPQVADQVLFHPSADPDARLTEEPRYVTWTPQVHRAP